MIMDNKFSVEDLFTLSQRILKDIMKYIVLFLFISLGIHISYADSWAIKTIYETQDVPRNCKALDSYGKPITSYSNSLETVDKLLIPCSIEDGKYKITIIEINSGFYRIKDTNYYIEMNGTNYFGPTSLFNNSAEVILIKDCVSFKIEYH